MRATLVALNGKVNKEFPLLGNKSASSVLDRLHLVYGVKNDNQLGEALQANRSTLGNWRARDSVPYTICVSAAEDRGISLDWLLTGAGAMLRGETGEAGGFENVASSDLAPQEKALLSVYQGLAESDQHELLRAAQQLRQAAALRDELRELQAVVASLIRSP
jgi:hypothetical protein